MATIKDVAKMAGVSVGTVSKVLNNIHVSEDNKKKVDAAIEALNYEVNIYARGMKAQYTNTVALIIPELINPFFALLTHYVEEELYKRNDRLVLCLSGGIAEKEEEFFMAARQNKIDGIIGLTYSDTERFVTDQLPFVSIDRYYQANVPCVTSDNYLGGVLAAREFYKNGCKNVAYFKTGAYIAGGTLERGRGFMNECKNLGLNAVQLDFGLNLTRETFAQVSDYFCTLKESGERPLEAVFFSSDDFALGTMECLKTQGYRFPEDAQIIGYDGLRVLNRYEPCISSIRQPIHKMAETCVDQLFRLLNGEPVELLTVLPVEFQEGYTTRRLK